MKIGIKKTLIEKINRSEWWHVIPRDPNAYKKRGKFLASTFTGANFYGRPNDIPEKVHISNPVFGFPETEILEKLFPCDYKKIQNRFTDEKYHDNWYENRIKLDARMFRRAKELGYDAIVLLGSTGKKALKKNRKPWSIELNLLYP